MKHPITYIVTVLLLSFLINLPMFFETRIVYSNEETLLNLIAKSDKAVLESLLQKSGTISYAMTSLRTNPAYLR